jgi:tetratricopeptide (TPR) repeat protein
VGLGGLTSFDLGELARLRQDEGRVAEAVTLYAAAAEVDPRSPHHPALQAMALGRMGRCEEAEQALQEAERRLEARRRPRDEGVVDVAREAVERCRQRKKHGGITFPETRGE